MIFGQDLHLGGNTGVYPTTKDTDLHFYTSQTLCNFTVPICDTATILGKHLPIDKKKSGSIIYVWILPIFLLY